MSQTNGDEKLPLLLIKVILENIAYSYGQVSFLTPNPKVRQTYSHSHSVGQLPASNCTSRVCHSKDCRMEEQNRMCSLCRQTNPKEKEEKEGAESQMPSSCSPNFQAENSLFLRRGERGQKETKNVIVMDFFSHGNKILGERSFPGFCS